MIFLLQDIYQINKINAKHITKINHDYFRHKARLKIRGNLGFLQMKIAENKR